MRPLSFERPKPLVPTLGVPQLWWALGALKAAGVRRAWVNARRGQGGGALEEAIGRAGAALALDVRVSPEPDEPLGTSGALHAKRAELDETFVVYNGDVACALPLGDLLARHRSAGAPATLTGIPTPDRADLVARDSWVEELVDRHLRSGAGHRYAGIGVFEPEVLAYVPQGTSHLFDTVMQGLSRAGNGIALFEWDGYWSDIADPAAHLRVNLDALRSRLPPSGPLRPLVGSSQRWDDAAYVGAGAAVDGAELREVVVGRDARLSPGTRLVRCVVWDGAAVDEGEYRDAVITPHRVVAAGSP
jgi:NDP-sugar pyrophosphorylase family protein